MDRIQACRTQLASGAVDEPTPAQFNTVADLKLAVLRMISHIRAERSGGGSALMDLNRSPHPWAVTYEVSLGYVPGTDDQMKGVIEILAKSDRRITLFELSPLSQGSTSLPSTRRRASLDA